MPPVSLFLGALVLSLGAPTAPAPPTGPDIGDHVALLLERLDDVEEGLIGRLASTGEAEALDGLIAAYDRLQSRYMRRAVLRALPRFDRHDGLGERAADKLSSVAAGSPSPLLREEALDALAECPRTGPAALMALVGALASDVVRESAMERLTRSPRDEDRLWYLEQYTGPPETGRRGGRRRELEVPTAPVLPRIRQLAFGVVRSTLQELDLADACKDRDREIRIDALLELEARESKLAVPIARDYFTAQDDHFQNRVAAAGVLWRALGRDVVDDFVQVGTDNVSPLSLRYALADYLTSVTDSAVERKLLKVFKRGSEHQKLFALRALRTTSTKKTVRALIRAVEDESPVVAYYALDLITERREMDAVETLRDLLEKGEDPDRLANVLDALARLLEDAGGASQELLAWSEHPAPPVRCAALSGLTRLRGAEAFDVLVDGLEDDDWTVQLAALRGLERIRTVACIGPVVDRLPHVEGRMLHELTGFLWRLTGQPFGERVATWTRWWEQEHATVEVLDETEIERLEHERRERRLKERTFTAETVQSVAPEHERSFFGVRIDSNRVVFVVDVSLSMERTLRDEYLGSRGLPRFDVARAELRRCLEFLDGDSYFNILAFSTNLTQWKDEMVRRDDEALASAKSFIDDLDMESGTDVWRALERALDIPDLDTIYILSDGEPEGGLIEDPVHIRMAFGRRNANRRMEVHAIALGGELPLLRWLAEDSGGSYTRYR